ncbi:hypothetical protein AVEN_107487-1 [Araneus ventricosus]|uniref:Uncharacterized protein n=1 Tax=Araneus ventricosus TaxID=182803 RepID=A0A4Y2BA05_ARAVE|nr:hypothetical protein AVEN_107487-1 [Araneus ventricosus]
MRCSTLSLSLPSFFPLLPNCSVLFPFRGYHYDCDGGTAFLRSSYSTSVSWGVAEEVLTKDRNSPSLISLVSADYRKKDHQKALPAEKSPSTPRDDEALAGWKVSGE